MIDDLVIRVLSKGGVNDTQIYVNIEGETTHERLSRHLSLLEAWSGLPNVNEPDEQDEMDMMEDAAPFDVDFYRAVEALLIEVWNPDEPSQKYLDVMDYHRQVKDPQHMSLFSLVVSIRVSRLLRHWLDLNVGGETMNVVTDGNVDSNNHMTLTLYLLKNASVDEGQALVQYPLIRALYGYVQNLPYLQSSICLFTQALTRGGTGDTTRVGQGLSSPQARLEYMQMSQQITEKLNQEFENHTEDLEFIVGEWYAMGSVDVRQQCRAQLGSVWSQFVARSSGVGGGGLIGAGMKIENSSSSGIAMTLRVLHRILLGTSDDLSKSHEHLLFYHLIPMHRPNSMVLWRDQTSLLDLYHEPLVQCIAVLLQKRPDWIGRVIAALLEPDVWSKGANTPKLVLLLHEIDTYIGCLPEPIQGNELGETFQLLLRALGSCMASENSRLAQRSLPFVKNTKFVSLLHHNLDLTLEVLLPSLLGKEPSWNPTVQKMTYNVLTTLQSINEEKFVAVGDKLLARNSFHALPSPHINPAQHGVVASKKRAIQENSSTNALLPKDYTIKSAMRGWKPPSSSGSSTMPPPQGVPRPVPGSYPPLSVTGVAPWAMTGSGARGDVPTKNPPLGVTGVAPWAIRQPPNMLSSGLSSFKEENEDSVSVQVESTSSGVLAYMEKIKPLEENRGASPWSLDQMAETPTLLPTLKFHDLVFGHELGAGSFGSVRYARLIDRSTTRSNWPEFAVKIISTAKIQEMGYEAPIQREIAVLRMLSHPCISRLVSSFRFHDGVYLVLEYASGGDLHTLLRKNGSMDHDSTRFVMGEVISALSSVHDLGLVYADLKPENVVISETGHIKLTDFGGSRPVTDTARRMIAESARNALQALRDGDWKVKAAKANDMDNGWGEGFHEYDPNQDLRIEGTTNYLPPEVVLGAFPSPAADSWALGCVIYQCLTGRPPIIDDDEARTKNRIVLFDASDANVDDNDNLFGDGHASNVESSARDLILLLLSRNPIERPTMNQVAEHDFFQEAGVDVFSLHQSQAHPLDIGDVAPPSGDAQWSRRQLSSIWAPQPQAYNIALAFDSTVGRGSASQSFGPILEGAEGLSFFSISNMFLSVPSGSLPPTGRRAG
jgi:serine/threonine protein kinase